MAFLNVAPWDPSSTTPAPASDPAAQESAQYDALFTGSFSVLDFIETGRPSIEQSAGGQPSLGRRDELRHAARGLALQARGRRPSTRRPA